MNLLIVAATKLEIKPFLKNIYCHDIDNKSINSFIYNDLHIDILITGIGLIFTTFQLTKALNEKKYDLIFNVGIAGSFNRNIQIGNIVHVVSEELADLGIENQKNFQTLFDSGFMAPDTFPFIEGKLKSSAIDNKELNTLPKVNAISANTAHGNKKTIKSIHKKFNPDIETMEGAAFFYVCLMENVNFIQLRGISNYVESRNAEKWNIPLAINNLAQKLIQILDSI
ncbi:MAG: futalosine hydrolase [Bacteroidales bacterium]|nr:futalosine hydrolase [Bacteroidales bacterium]